MYKIMGTYRGHTEEIDCCDSAEEANYLAHEYRMAFGDKWQIWVKG